MATEQRNLKLSYVDASLMSAFMQFTPGVGSIYYDAVNKIIRIGDGATKGGVPMVNVSQLNTKVSTTDLADLVHSIAYEVIPGSIIAYLGRSVPAGYLLCNGGTIQRSQYPRLVPVLGSIPEFQGDGSTTLVLPNLQGRFAEFTTDTNQVGKYVEAGLPNITGKFGQIIWNGSVEGAFEEGYTPERNVNKNTVSNGYEIFGSVGFDANNVSTVYGNSDTVQPRALQVLPLIKF